MGIAGALYCGDKCRWNSGNKKAAQRAEAFRPAERRDCAECGSDFIVGYGYLPSSARFCGKECKKRNVWRRLPSGNTHVRRAKKYGVPYEMFNKVEVFQRDGWRCGICGIETPQHLSGTTANNAPQLDHIVPLSRGGAHSKENTQCACRSCNYLKRDRTPAQMWAELLAA